jgi:hypothetical protein
MRRYLLASAFCVLAGALSVATPAAAQGPPVERSTERIVNETDTFIDVHPCTGQPAEVSTVDNGIIHFAAFADGTVHFTGTIRSTFSADLLPTNGTPDATGRVVTWFGGNGLLNEDGTASGKAQTAFTFNGRGTNADGSTFTFHQNGNIVFDPNGDPKVEVFRERAHCS